MKKVFLSIFVLGAVLTSCGDTIEAQDAKEVVDNSTETTISFDKVEENAKINFVATHIGGFAPRKGFFKISEGSLQTTNNVVTNGNFTIDISSLTIDVTSVDKEEDKGKLEGHLKSPDFFTDSLYPTAKFEITDVINEFSQDSSFSTKLTGNLTLLDSTKSVTFFANINSNENETSVKSEKFSIDRTQWGLSYGSEGLADASISNAVELEVDIKLTK